MSNWIAAPLALVALAAFFGFVALFVVGGVWVMDRIERIIKSYGGERIFDWIGTALSLGLVLAVVVTGWVFFFLLLTGRLPE